MAKIYKHLTTLERAVVMTMRDDLCPIRSIAKRLCGSASTIRRVHRPALIDGLDPDEFYLRNADAIALHQDGLWECMAEAEQGDIAFTDANDSDCIDHSG